MRKLTCNFVLAALAISVFSLPAPAQRSTPSEKYQLYREAATEPAYGLAKVKSMIAKLKPDSRDAKALSESAFAALPFEQKFTYVMLHGEDFTQNCSEMPPVVGEDKKIFAYPASPFAEEEMWSERQKKFLTLNRAKVIALLRSTIRERHRVGVNLKAAIIELKAQELIPDLVAVYNRDKKDQDILSTMMVLMKEGNYKPFTSSSSYRKLYGEKASYQSYIVANAANQRLVIDRALAYHNSRRA